MFRNQLARLFALGEAIFVAGCDSTGSMCSTCSDRPPLFSRFRTTSTTQPVMISSGDCCNGTVVGPYIPPAPGTIIPPQPQPQPNSVMPSINDNGQQKLWNGQPSGRTSIKTGSTNNN